MEAQQPGMPMGLMPDQMPLLVPQQIPQNVVPIVAPQQMLPVLNRDSYNGRSLGRGMNAMVKQVRQVIRSGAIVLLNARSC